MKCIYKAPCNICLQHSTEETIEFCVEGPCPDEVMAEELDRQYYDFRRGVSDWTQYVRELKAYNAELAGMVIEYLDDIIPGYRERAEKAERERDDFQALLTAYKNVCGEVLTGRIQELVEADREGAVHIGSCGFCEYYQMDKFCCCPDWVEDDYAIVRNPQDYCTKFKKASWVDEIWGENGCPSCPGYRPTALKERKQDG